jgi:phosphoglucosamine mutase
MSKYHLFGTSGIRRIVDKSLFELIFNIGFYLGGEYKNVLAGCDTRTSSEPLKMMLKAGLRAVGAKVSDCGVLPTPTLAFSAKEFDIAAMITASHNPPEYNGIKIINPDGSAFDSQQRKKLQEKISLKPQGGVAWNEIGSRSLYQEAIKIHIEAIKKLLKNQKINARIVVDCGCGAGSLITPVLLKSMGCEVIQLNCDPSGFFPRVIEPVEANLGDLKKAVQKNGADIGIAHDGDADRMMAVDNRGNFIPGDKLMVLLALGTVTKEIVTTIDASMVLEEIGYSTIRTAIGDNYVSQELKEGGSFGGEPSGNWVFPEISLCPDGIYAAAKIALLASREDISELVAGIPSYPIMRGSVGNNRKEIRTILRNLKKLNPVSIKDTDGIKMKFDDGWLLVRPSGTEPKIRITAEARTWVRVNELYEHALKAIKQEV